ncbi:hypothetical protein JCM10908_006426 [Rhodotorula pacifica]|uniref:MFS transporter n=1 Tax=Rhodotorula pacifica TaxID=1495444 RepID=UPI0031719A1A
MPQSILRTWSRPHDPPALGRTLSSGVVQHHLDPREELTFPQLTESGAHTDAYLEESATGLVSAREAEAGQTFAQTSRRVSQSTLVSQGAVTPPSAGEKGSPAKLEGQQESDDAKLVTWLIDDPQNPRHFGHTKKWVQTLIPTSFCFIAGFASSLITGGIPEQAEYFGVSELVANLVVCVFVVGFGIGPLILAPLSEMYGRRIVYIVSMFLYFIFILPECVTTSFAVLIVFRFLSGLMVSGVMTNAAGSIGDLWAINERGYKMVAFSGILFASPCLGPLIGGYLTITRGWRAMWWLLFGFSGGMWAICSPLLVETYAPTLLQWRAKRLRKESGDNTIMTEQERQKRPISEVMHETLLRPVVMLTTEPIMMCMAGYLSLIYGLLYAFFFAYPIVFIAHGFNAGEIGLTFLSIFIGIVIVVIAACPVQERYYRRRVVECGGATPPPEARLPLMMVGCVVLPIALFIFAGTSPKSVHWAGALVSGIPFGFALVAVYISANTYIAVAFSQYSASAMAAKTFFRSMVGASMPMWIPPFYTALGHFWAGAFFAFLAVAMAPIPFIFFYYGDRIRARSKMAS